MPHRPSKTSARSAASGGPDLPADFADYKVAALPIVANFCQQLGVTRTVDAVIDSPGNIGSGQVVAGMVMDTLSGRSPLYKLHEHFAGQDMELLFGTDLKPSDFNDNNVGKVLDNIHAYGASRLFSQIAWEACGSFGLDGRHLHYDTTSVSVHGAYETYAEEAGDVVAVTYGHSKDRRPDLKQFMIGSLCVEGGVPLLGAVLSGNTSDKTANNAELTRVAGLIRKHGLDPKAHVYIADSAMVTEANLGAINRTGQHFVSRLPAVYGEEGRAVEAAFEAGDWTEAGTLALEPDPSKARPSARYKLREGTVTLYGREYRAVVVHSSAHDKRRLKKLDKQLAADREAFRKLEKELAKTRFACEADARRHAGGLAAKAGLKHHGLDTRVVAEPVYARGRPPKGRPRKVKATRYRVEATLVPDRERVDALRERSGCFVLISNLPDEGENAHTGTEILRAYKEQYGIENNFRFLKDPLIVNDTFLKKAERIEALGFILLLSLMVWNLVQLVIRRHLRERGSTILGWDNKQTSAPTTMMVFHYFQHISVYVWNAGRNRRLSRPLLDRQKDYLGAMGLPESIFTTPVKTYRN